MVDSILKWTVLTLSGIVAVFADDVLVNNEVIIKCTVNLGTYPTWTGPSNTSLTNGSQILEPGFEWVNETHLKIASAQTIQSGTYRCSNGSAEGVFTLNVLSHALDVKFLNAFGDSDVQNIRTLINQTITVTCQVKGGNPKPNVTIAPFDETRNSPNLTDFSTVYEISENNTYIVNASVTFLTSNDIHMSVIECSAENGGNKTESALIIYILYPPLIRGFEKGPPVVGPSAVFKCFSQSRPNTTFNWMVDGQNTTSGDNVTKSSACADNIIMTETITCQSNITFNNLQKEDTGKVISCSYVFENEVYATVNVTTLSVQFDATDVMISGDGRGKLNATDTGTITLTCSSDASNPVSKLQWTIGHENNYLTGTTINSTYTPIINDSLPYDGKTITQEIDIAITRSMDGMYVFCCIRLKSVCDSVKLNISYPPTLLFPQRTEYYAYVGSNISIPCIADSNPSSNIAWYHTANGTLEQISNNSMGSGNLHYLPLPKLMMGDAGNYICKAWLESDGVDKAVEKTVKVIVVDLPSTEPSLSITTTAATTYVEFSTSATAPDVPRMFYVQHRDVASKSYWLSAEIAYEDTLPGQTARTYRHQFGNGELLAGTAYEIRLKSVDANGLVVYSTTNSFQTDSKPEEDMVTKKMYVRDVLISVLVTAGGFIIIIIGIVCLVKHGKCLSSSAKSYVM